MARVRVTINPAALGRFLNDPSGKPQQFIEQKARELANRVQQNIPSSSGDLKSKVRVTDSSSADLQFLRPNATGITRAKRVIVDADHAAVVELGSGPRRTDLEGNANPGPAYWPKASDSLVAWALRETPNLLRFDSMGNPNIFIIQRAIHNNGTPSYGYMRKSLKQVFPTARGRFGKT